MAFVPFAAAGTLVPNGGLGFTLSLVRQHRRIECEELSRCQRHIGQLRHERDTFGRVESDLITLGIEPTLYVIGPNEALWAFWT